MIDANKELPIMEAFYTIQGEGFYTGKAAYFIRIAGCEVGCHWCDVKESWDIAPHPIISIEQIVSEAKKTWRFSGNHRRRTSNVEFRYTYSITKK